MLTPVFDLTQNEQELIVSIQVPFAKVSDVQVEFEDHDFMFYSKPYYLRLNLPGKVAYCEEPSIKYDFDKRTFIIHAPKLQEGEIFENLDLITKLLAPRKKKIVKSPLIEVIEGTEYEYGEEIDCNVEQVRANEDLESVKVFGEQCGFANSYSFSVFNLKEETAEIFDVKDPQHKTPQMRKEERLKEESKDFNEDHYVADLYEDDEIQNVLKYQPEWDLLYEELQTNSSFCADEKISFTSEEKDRLLKLPNKEYLLDKTQRESALLGLVDILFAYSYDRRTTEGEYNVESAWTINKLSATLSWLEVFTSDISEVAHTCIRRSLCYPIYRHFELSVTCLEDVRKILLLGRKYVIKCLLKIQELFNLSEPRYILNDLFITDYCVWMQTKMCSSKNLEPIAEKLGKVLLTKGDIKLNLVDIESFAAVAWMSKENPISTKISVETVVNSEKASHESIISVESLNSDLEKLSLQRNSDLKVSAGNSETSEDNSLHGDELTDSDYEICSSCTSDSSDSSSTFESSDSSEESDVEVVCDDRL